MAEPQANEQPQQQNRGGSGWGGFLFQALMLYLLMNTVFKQKGAQPQIDATTGQSIPPVRNAWNAGQVFHLIVYLSETNDTFTNFDDKSAKVWQERGLVYFNQEELERTHSIVLPLTEHLYNNGSLYAHIFVYRDGTSPNPKSPMYTENFVYKAHQLNRYAPKKLEVAKKNLLSGEAAQPEPVDVVPEIRPIISYWKPNLTLHLIEDPTTYPANGIPPQISEHMQFTKDNQSFYPILYVDEFWLLTEALLPINETINNVTLSFSYTHMSLMKWQMMIQFEQSMLMHQSFGTQTAEDGEEFKRMLLDTNPYLLAVTFVVTILHSVFDFLAFKNDVAFWRNKKSLEGLSVRSLLIGAVSQTVIFLYLLDNDTSWMILISAGIGLLIEYWKVQKAVILTPIKKEFSIFGIKITLPWIEMKDRDSYASETKVYDEQAMKYLSYVLYPLIVCYAIYSLMYESHKSWYSFILGTLVGCVYTFGFIMMTPQLFINYKMKSVAHLPWKTFMYKALNTFIDDLFAFIIKMPLLHRLSCFRDDIIFLIFLYQRWVYPVDKKRVNEFGQGGDEAKPTSTTDKPDTSAPKIEQKEEKDKKDD